MADPHRKTDAERALLDTQNTTELAALHRWHKNGSVPSTHTAEGNDGTEPTARPRPASSPRIGTAWGEPHRDPLAAARGIALAVAIGLAMWAIGIGAAWAIWRWWGG